jgi:hypothetical protein
VHPRAEQFHQPGRDARLDVPSDSPSTDNPSNTRPQKKTKINGYEVELPEFWETVCSLDQVVDVDYYVPGCPPQAHQIWAVIEAVIDILKNGKPLPPKGAVLGAGDKTCCDECERTREEKKIKKFYRPHEIIPTRIAVFWIRAFSAWGRRRATDAAADAHRSGCHVAVATGRRRIRKTKARK